jgi:hypothetical protein
MSIDLQHEELLTLSSACRLLPRVPSPATLWRWRTKGVLVNGQRIRMTCVRAGGVWYTTRNSFAEFLRRQTEAALSEPIASDDQEQDERTEEKSAALREAKLLGP